MEEQKGFSLIELLLCLSLTTTTILSLIHLHINSKLFLQQLNRRVQASHLLDQREELLLLDLAAEFKPPTPFQIRVEETARHRNTAVYWFNEEQAVIRSYSVLMG
jgi:prepilin-type N-terminal cleavage/methylation domain-containing protein